MKIDKLDKILFKMFKKTDFPLNDPFLCEKIYFNLLGYVMQVLRFRTKGIWVYGIAKIEIDQKSIDEYISKANEIVDNEYKQCALEYLSLATQTAEKLNKYIVKVEEPVYMRIMNNYNFMKETLHDVPWFHDAYVVKSDMYGKDLFLKFALYASDISRENTRIYKLNPEYRGENNQILITIKFANVELLSGSFEEDFIMNRNFHFLSDLEYETLSDQKHTFNLFAIQERELIFNCEYIEFVPKGEELTQNKPN